MNYLYFALDVMSSDVCQILVEPGFGKDVRLQPPLSPPISPISRVKHASYGPVSPVNKSSSKAKLRVRHSSEPAKG